VYRFRYSKIQSSRFRVQRFRVQGSAGKLISS
jgi:hypothetical protein